MNRRKYESKYDMISKVAAEYWIYREYSNGIGTPRNPNIRRLHQAGSSENLKGGRSDHKLGEFKFLEF